MGKSLIHDPARARLVRRAFEEYATGRFTKEQLLKQSRTWRLANRRGKPLTSQAIGMLLRNQLYAGIVHVPEYGVRAKRGDFDALHRPSATCGELNPRMKVWWTRPGSNR